jgi:hypothetical protein
MYEAVRLHLKQLVTFLVDEPIPQHFRRSRKSERRFSWPGWKAKFFIHRCKRGLFFYLGIAIAEQPPYYSHVDVSYLPSELDRENKLVKRRSRKVGEVPRTTA